MSKFNEAFGWINAYIFAFMATVLAWAAIALAWGVILHGASLTLGAIGDIGRFVADLLS